MAEELVSTPVITINPSARPPKAQGKPCLVAFSDGSSVAYAAAVYVIYRVPKIVAGPLIAPMGGADILVKYIIALDELIL